MLLHWILYAYYKTMVNAELSSHETAVFLIFNHTLTNVQQNSVNLTHMGSDRCPNTEYSRLSDGNLYWSTVTAYM